MLTTDPKNDDNYTLIKLYKVQDDAAKCLDGSPAAFYYKKGRIDKYVIFFEGGGWCGDVSVNATLTQCLGRSKTTLGSSSQYPGQITLGGIFSRDPKVNPEFFNHTTVFIKYCDGAGHQGYNKDPYTVNGTKIWFRGYNNTIQTIEYLIHTLALGKANEVVVSGSSAGGLATYTWVDYIHDRVKQVNPSVKVVGLPDSGLFLDLPTGANQSYNIQRTKIQNVMALANKEVDPINFECVDTHKDAKWKCLYAETLVLSIKTPLFFIESQYDRWSLHNILQYSCADNGNLTTCKPDENQKIQNYRQKTVGVIEDSLKRNPRWGAWAPSCIDHGYTGNSFNNVNYEIPSNSNWTLSKTIQVWMNSTSNETIKHMDPNPWPSNRPCSHL